MIYSWLIDQQRSLAYKMFKKKWRSQFLRAHGDVSSLPQEFSFTVTQDKEKAAEPRVGS